MTLLAVGLPLVAFLVMWGLAIISIWMQRRRGGWRPYGEAFLLAALTWGMSVTIITEGLSVAHALTFAALATCWALIDIIGVSALVGVWLRQRRTGAGGASWEEATQPAVAVSRKYASVWYISVGITVIILAVTGITANAAPGTQAQGARAHRPIAGVGQRIATRQAFQRERGTNHHGPRQNQRARVRSSRRNVSVAVAE